MGFEISERLNIVLQAIEGRITIPMLHDRHQLKMLLESLSPLEQLLIARNFCKLPWNIGSLRVLKVLQESNILTASNYILNIKNSCDLQLILNDFLEAEFELIKELFIVGHYDSNQALDLNDILDECLTRLYTDLLKNSQLNDLKYIDSITKHVPNDFVLSLVQRHIRNILHLHKSNIETAFSNFTNWINEGVDEIPFAKQLFNQLLRQTEQDSISYLFNLSTAESFMYWKFYLILLQTIGSNCSAESATFIRKYLKARLAEITALPSLGAMQHLLLSVRAATATTMDIDKNVTAYAEWYKQNISDMKFVLKAEEFQTIIDLLTQCIVYETTEDYIDIHATFSISPPIHCGKLVQAYKSKCKMQLAKIKLEKKGNNCHEESIHIDDSD